MHPVFVDETEEPSKERDDTINEKKLYYRGLSYYAVVKEKDNDHCVGFLCSCVHASYVSEIKTRT